MLNPIYTVLHHGTLMKKKKLSSASFHKYCQTNDSTSSELSNAVSPKGQYRMVGRKILKYLAFMVNSLWKITHNSIIF